MRSGPQFRGKVELGSPTSGLSGQPGDSFVPQPGNSPVGGLAGEARTCGGTFSFVASPYSNPDPAIVLQRYRAAVHFVGWAALEGLIVFSSIVHSHIPATSWSLPTDHGFWLKINMAMLRAASALHVLALDGWEQSAGVAAELREAGRLGLPVKFFERAGDGWVSP
ncbi:MAG: DUF1937 family protein [Rhodospirillaceae bacterium]